MNKVDAKKERNSGQQQHQPQNGSKATKLQKIMQHILITKLTIYK
jgi:hypothetical protein